MAGPGWTHTRGHEVHVTGGVWHDGKEGVEIVDQPENSIWTSARPVQQLPTVTARGTGEVGENLQRAVPTRNSE